MKRRQGNIKFNEFLKKIDIEHKTVQWKGSRLSWCSDNVKSQLDSVTHNNLYKTINTINHHFTNNLSWDTSKYSNNYTIIYKNVKPVGALNLFCDMHVNDTFVQRPGPTFTSLSTDEASVVKCHA